VWLLSLHGRVLVPVKNSGMRIMLQVATVRKFLHVYLFIYLSTKHSKQYKIEDTIKAVEVLRPTKGCEPLTRVDVLGRAPG